MSLLFLKRRDLYFYLPALFLSCLTFLLYTYVFKVNLQKREAASQLQLKNLEDFDIQTFEQLLARFPDSSDLIFNLALAYIKNKENEKALNFYNFFLSNPKTEKNKKFFAFFNRAVLKFQLQDIDGSLKDYQQALFFQYETLKIKTNIELMLKSQQSQNKKNNKDQKDNKDNKEQKDKNKQEGSQKSPEQNQNNQKKEKPQPDSSKNSDKGKSKKPQPEFKSPNLTKEQAQQILKEIKGQEAQFLWEKFKNDKKRPKAYSPKGKDW